MFAAIMWVAIASLSGLATLSAWQAAPPAPSLPPLDCTTVAGTEIHESAIARFKEGEGKLLAAKWVEAEAPLLRSISFDPLFALAHYGLGQSYMEQRRFTEAVGAFKRSREAFRCAPPLSEEERKQKTQEIRGLRESLRSADQRRLKEIAARWREMNGDMRTAVDGIRTAHDVERRLAELEESVKSADPVPLGVTLALGTALFQSGSIPEAEAAFRAVLARDASSGDAHNNLAVVCMMTGRLDEAEREIAAAQKAGVPVNPRLKGEIDRRRREGTGKPS